LLAGRSHETASIDATFVTLNIKQHRLLHMVPDYAVVQSLR
jgi:hypothetical protein